MASESLKIPAAAEEMSRLYNLLSRFGETAAPWIEDGMVYPAFMTAVVEIATNIIRHAYPAEGGGGEMELALNLYAGRLEARFRDQGVPYDAPQEPAAAPPTPADPLELPEGGFGLFVARQALDTLDYRRTTGGDNCWLLVKEF